MNQYQSTKFSQFETLELNKWYGIDPNRADLSDFLKAVKLRIELHKNMALNSDETQLKRIRSFAWEVQNIGKHGDFMPLIHAHHDRLVKQMEINHPKKHWQK